MGFIDDFKRWAKGEDEDEEEYEEFEPRTRERDEREPAPVDFRRGNNNKVVNIHATTQLSVW